MKTKICPNCKIEKLVSEFNKCLARKKDGLAWECRKCRSIRDKQNYQRNRKSIIAKVKQYWAVNHNRKRNNDLKLKYNITLSDYDKMFEKQNGVCAMCKILPKEKHHRSKRICPLHVDHSHETGKVRGLLCRNCNQALGKYELHKNNILQYLNQFQN